MDKINTSVPNMSPSSSSSLALKKEDNFLCETFLETKVEIKEEADLMLEDVTWSLNNSAGFLQGTECLQQGDDIDIKPTPDGNLHEDQPSLGNKLEPPESDEDLMQMLSSLQNTCPICERKFRYPSRLRRHMDIHNGERKFKCTICGATFKVQTSLKTHILTHSAIKPFKCSMCPSTQCTRSALRQHIARTHSTGEKQVVCNVCGHGFRTKGDLQKHFVRHAGKNVLCTVCGKLFYTEKNLKTHIAKTHELTTDNAPEMFQCSHCNRVYGYKSHLTNHILHVHLQEREYECYVCNKKFAAKAQIHRHMSGHSKEKFTCNCGRTFSTKTSFDRHCLTHINYRPYTCDMCGLTFTQKSSVERHIITNMEKEHFKRTGTCKPITGGRGGYYAVNDIY